MDAYISGADISKFAKKAELTVDVVVRKVALDLYDKITRKTPVDTGRARANWNMSAGRPNYKTTKKTKKQNPRLKKGDGLKDIYITNNLPYIQALELGHSKQSPPHAMVRKSLQEVKAGLT